MKKEKIKFEIYNYQIIVYMRKVFKAPNSGFRNKYTQKSMEVGEGVLYS